MSRAETLAELVTRFRVQHGAAGDDVAGMALVADDARACRMLAAFRAVPQPAWRRPRGAAPADAGSLWTWLWSGYGAPDAPPFLPELAAAAGVPEADALEVWRVVRASRLVRPDWSVAEEAMLVLRGHVARVVRRPRGGKP